MRQRRRAVDEDDHGSILREVTTLPLPARLAELGPANLERVPVGVAVDRGALLLCARATGSHPQEDQNESDAHDRALPSVDSCARKIRVCVPRPTEPYQGRARAAPAFRVDYCWMQ
jgi:hypothetical protein